MTDALRATGRAWSPRFRRARREAVTLYREWRSRPMPPEFVHPVWEDARLQFEDFVGTGVPFDFLHRQIVRHMMYRTGFGALEEHELAAITEGPDEIRRLCESYDESPVGMPIVDCESLGVSVSSLNKLYYFSRIAAAGRSFSTIMDFGAGYGHMCHVFAQLIEPRPTFILVDLPELLALQYVFLKASGVPVVAHTTAGRTSITPGAANLVPIQSLVASDDGDLACDLFLSTFALSETPAPLQQLIAERRFFSASSLYVTGQQTTADLWSEYDFHPMERLQAAASEQFSVVSIEPFPVVSAWELRAQAPVREP
jgi:hypothetical protein